MEATEEAKQVEDHQKTEVGLLQDYSDGDRQSDTMLMNMNEESVEQINLFIDGKFNREFAPSEQNDSQALIDEQDSEVFRVASEVASVRKSLATEDQNDLDQLRRGHQLSRPVLVDNNHMSKQAAFSTNEPKLKADR